MLRFVSDTLKWQQESLRIPCHQEEMSENVKSWPWRNIQVSRRILWQSNSVRFIASCSLKGLSWTKNYYLTSRMNLKSFYWRHIYSNFEKFSVYDLGDQDLKRFRNFLNKFLWQQKLILYKLYYITKTTFPITKLDQSMPLRGNIRFGEL